MCFYDHFAYLWPSFTSPEDIIYLVMQIYRLKYWRMNIRSPSIVHLCRFLMPNSWSLQRKCKNVVRPSFHLKAETLKTKIKTNGKKTNKKMKLHGPSVFAVKAKMYGVIYNQSSSIAFDETSSHWSAPKSFQFLGFSLVITR